VMRNCRTIVLSQGYAVRLAIVYLCLILSSTCIHHVAFQLLDSVPSLLYNGIAGMWVPLSLCTNCPASPRIALQFRCRQYLVGYTRRRCGSGICLTFTLQMVNARSIETAEHTSQPEWVARVVDDRLWLCVLLTATP